ncbi:MAG: formate dehydrogenase subunit gamma [Pseudomonadota bacterium]
MAMSRSVITALVVLVLASGLVLMTGNAQAQAPNQTDPALQTAPVAGGVPGGTLGLSSDAEMWRAVRQGVTGTVSIPDRNAAMLVQSEGENWRAIRNGPIKVYGAYALGGIVALLILFFLIRGRIRIDHGKAGVTITRFTTIERAGHWLLAVSFILLALTGLNLLYGKFLLMPIIGKEAFTAVSMAGKYIHNYVAFAFMAGLALTLAMWFVHNLPSRTDIVWLLKGGGVLVKGVHPPAKKFNAGQKMIFWLVILGGFSLSLSGWALLFPFTTTAFSDTFGFINSVAGTSLPTDLSPIQEQQFNQIWHNVMSVFMICVIIAHIYIGSVGMEGAFDAMGTGEVDLNWAKEHHSLWVEKVQSEEAARPGGSPQPAE